MGPLNVLVWVVGIGLVLVGYQRGRGPWSRYQAMKEQDQNAARYAAWRGGARDDSTEGASLAMEILLRQARIAGAIAIAGVVLVVLGFLIK